MPWTKFIADSAYNNTVEEDNKRVISYQAAIKEAIEMSMKIDPDVIVLGEGINAPGYVYNTTDGLSEKFGTNRVIETPIAEAAMTGVTLGASITGLKPVLIHMRNDFLLVSMDQIVNHIAHWKSLFNRNVPLVIRAVVSRGWGSGAQHSQNFHYLFSSFEGLKVVLPSTPYDVKGMFLKAVSLNEPVIFLEHRWLYSEKSYVPPDIYLVPIDKSILRRQGKDITIIGISVLNREIKIVLDELVKENITADWIDLVSVNPLDMEPVYESLKKTGKLLIVDNGPIKCGVGAEISAKVMEKVFDYLKCPVKRIGWNGTTIPAGVKLEENFYPNKEFIKKSILKMVK
jgi:pyruvate dehydrogenase E1 component beta subunit